MTLYLRREKLILAVEWDLGAAYYMVLTFVSLYSQIYIREMFIEATSYWALEIARQCPLSSGAYILVGENWQ